MMIYVLQNGLEIKEIGEVYMFLWCFERLGNSMNWMEYKVIIRML